MSRGIPQTVGEISPAPVQRWDRRIVIAAIGYVVLYVLLDSLSYIQPVLKLGITPWNPQAGLTLAFLLIYGPRWFSVTAAASVISEVLVRDMSASSPLVLGASVWIALGYGGLAAILRHYDVAAPLRTTIAATRFAGISVGGTLVVAAGYVVLFLTAGELPLANALGILPRLWIGDLTGIITLTPLLVYAPEWRAGLKLARQRIWELLAQCFALLGVFWLIFGLSDDQLRFFYPLFVPVIWIALRWGLPGAMCAAFAIQVGLLVAAEDVSQVPPLVDLQFLMLTLSLTALLLGAVVTERAAVLRRVAMREAEQRALLAMAPDAVLAVDRAGSIRMANPAALKLFGERASEQRRAGVEEFLPGLDMSLPEGRATLEGLAAGGEAFPAEIAWARLDSPANEGFLVTIRDATDRHRAQAQLRERDTALARAMRFAVAGELASALAHELNQPITALVSYLRASEILAAPLRVEDDRFHTTLSKAAHEAMRASEVLRRLRDFYQGSTLKREVVHIPSVCASVSAAFEERLRRAGVLLVTRVNSYLPTIEADVTAVEIALHNLLSNAIEALTHSARPERRIELRAVFGADTIFLSVADSGGGISPEVSQKLFEPFVTSKPDGMGLGLAISRSLLRARGGDLSLQPDEKLGGACFVMKLPLAVPANDEP